jgi:putative transposase
MAADILDIMAQGKMKRFFRAKTKIDTPNLISHLTQRAAGGEPLFVEEKDYLTMLGFMKEYAGKYGVEFYSFCLMPNHVHVLLSPREKNLSAFMRALLSQYAGYFNRKYERKGHLFGAPYRQALCFDDSYFLAVSLYIHLNPVRAGMVANPAQYRWSSCRLFLRDDAPDSFVLPARVLMLLSDDMSRARALYREFLRKASSLPLGHVLEEGSAVEKFLDVLHGTFPDLFGKWGLKGSLPGRYGIDLVSMQELDLRIREYRQGPKSRSPETAEAREYLVRQLLARGFSREEIGQRLGMSRKTIYNITK